MLFASTRLTLLRELGTEKFSDSLFVTTADELSPSEWQKRERSDGAGRPLTAEERSLEEIRNAEAAEGRGTARRQLAGGSGATGWGQGGQSAVGFRVDDKALEALKRLKEEGKEENLVQLVCRSCYDLLR